MNEYEKNMLKRKQMWKLEKENAIIADDLKVRFLLSKG